MKIGDPAQTPDWNGDAPSLSLGALLHEAARAMHCVAPLRFPLVLIGALTAALVLHWPLALGWLTGVWAIEAWSWIATRTSSRGGPMPWRSRRNFAARDLVMLLWWLLLDGLLWQTGDVVGRVCGTVLFLTLLSMPILRIYNVAAIFLFAGAGPAFGALSVVTLSGGYGWFRLLPLWISVLMTMIFWLGRALETPSLQQSNRRLSLSLNRFEVLAEHVPDMIARLDLEGRYLYVSPASLRVLGYAPAELVGTLLADRLQSGDRQIVDAVLHRLVADPSKSQFVTALAGHKDGRWLWIQTSVKLVHEHGVVVGVIGVSRDISEKVAAEAALQAAVSEAQSASRTKSEFLSNISHEFRTPMNGVLGALHLLQDETLSPDGRALLRSAEDCGRTLSQLLNNVLDFSRISTDRLEVSPEPMDMGELVRATTDILRGEATLKGLDLRCDIIGDDRWIHADPVRLRQALFNLVSNAVKFTCEGHVSVVLRVETAPKARRRIQIDVEDTGIGISPKVRTLLFDQFRQAEGGVTRSFGGAGLGLSMTRALVLMMGGAISFTSREGEGSTFSLTFEAPAVDPLARAPLVGDILDGVKILLVDDNATNRLVARTMLTRLGAAVDDAEDGALGVEAAGCGAYDLILMDIQMPRMDGVAATRAIRKLPGAASQVPIIALTANVMDEQKAEYLSAGMNGVVAKPIAPATLLTEIARLTESEELARTG